MSVSRGEADSLRSARVISGVTPSRPLVEANPFWGIVDHGTFCQRRRRRPSSSTIENRSPRWSSRRHAKGSFLLSRNRLWFSPAPAAGFFRQQCVRRSPQSPVSPSSGLRGIVCEKSWPTLLPRVSNYRGDQNGTRSRVACILTPGKSGDSHSHKMVWKPPRPLILILGSRRAYHL